ncbi:MAG: formate transporter [Acidobacteria bacterium]|nr:MAG: formate transporter [Acidobacteriota bacterium]
MDFVNASEAMAAARQAAVNKATLSVPQMLLRGALAGALLGYATSLALIIVSQGVVPIAAALCFPVGFVMLVLLGLELATGNFAIMSFGVAGGEIGWRDVARNWSWVYAGNLIGSLVYAVLFYLAITNMGSAAGGPLADQVRKIAQAKTLGYAAFGARGVAAAFIKGVLCNWMVTLGAVLAFASRSTIGKIVAMWLPIATFFAHGYEHSIVNMFVVPAGMLLGTPVSVAGWWFWNQIPVTLGNIVAGVLLTGFTLSVSYPKPAESHVRAA